MSFHYKTADDTSSRGKANLYFCCHSADFARYFHTVTRDIFAKRNCAIWYADPGDLRDEAFLEQLKQMRLFIMPVSTNLLCTPNPALDLDFRFALENHIPVLPLMMEPELEDIFNQKCGELHFLDRHSQDRTAISYETKLEKYLSAILFDGNMTDMIRSAFDAYVFLSYRKKDRSYANELLRSIHRDPAFRSIAVWYDEFLVPGESFRDNIQQMMESSKLFMLLVTPKIAEKVLDERGILRDNYVISTELPLARKNKAERGIGMIAVEMEETDRQILTSLGLTDCTDYALSGSRTLLTHALSQIAPRGQESPRHKLHIGLAYLGGIDVEINRELAVSLITEAAEADHAPAIAKLAGMYYNGEGVAIDLETSLHYYEKLCRIQEAEFRRTGTEKSVKDWIDTQDQIGSILMSLRRFSDAGQHFATMLQHCKKLSTPTIFSWQGRALLHGAKKAPYARYGKALARLGLAKLLKDSKDDDDRILFQYEDYLDDADWDLMEYEDLLSDFGKKALPESIDTQLLQAEILLGAGKPQEALELVEALRKDISSPQINRLLVDSRIAIAREHDLHAQKLANCMDHYGFNRSASEEQTRAEYDKECAAAIKGYEEAAAMVDSLSPQEQETLAESSATARCHLGRLELGKLLERLEISLWDKDQYHPGTSFRSILTNRYDRLIQTVDPSGTGIFPDLIDNGSQFFQVMYGYSIDSASNHYWKALELLRGELEQPTANILSIARECLIGLGELTEITMDWQKAAACYAQICTLAEKHAALVSQNSQWQNRMLDIHEKLAILYGLLKQPAQQLRHLTESRRLYHSMEPQEPGLYDTGIWDHILDLSDYVPRGRKSIPRQLRSSIFSPHLKKWVEGVLLPHLDQAIEAAGPELLTHLEPIADALERCSNRLGPKEAANALETAELLYQALAERARSSDILEFKRTLAASRLQALQILEGAEGPHSR